MESGDVLQLDYQNPVTAESTSFWQSVKKIRWLPYWYGLWIGSFGLNLCTQKHAGEVIIATIVLAILGMLCTLLIVGAFSLRKHFLEGNDGCGRRLFVPLTMILLYPAFHMTLCKFVEWRTQTRYAIHASPFEILFPWLAIAIIATVATWNSPALGRKKVDWFLAGVSWPISCLAIVSGMIYLRFSWLGSDYPTYSTGFLIVNLSLAAFMWPLILCVTFAMFPAKPTAVPQSERRVLAVS